MEVGSSHTELCIRITRGPLQNTPHSGPIPKDSNITGLGGGRGETIICFNLPK